MQITLYKSALCPRCARAAKYLAEIKSEFPSLEIETIDVGLHPLQSLRAHIGLIPTIVTGNKKLTMAFPVKETIKEFLITQGLQQ